MAASKRKHIKEIVSISATENEVYKSTCIRPGMTMWDPYPAFCHGQCCIVKKRLKQNKENKT